MISKVCAVWLVLLVLSPFTAPFATCDLLNPSSSAPGAVHAVRITGRSTPFRVQLMAEMSESPAVLPSARNVTERPRVVARVASAAAQRFSAPLADSPPGDDSPFSQRTQTLLTVIRV